jgi:phytoene dehydrogenase-like protein
MGGGVAGLTAAALLAVRGLKVHLLEKEAKVGGYVTGFRRKGFYFDATSAFLAACLPGSAFHAILAELGIDRHLAFLPIPAIRNVYPGFQLHVDYRSPEAYVKAVAERFPQHAAGLAAYAELTSRVGREFLAFEQARFWQRMLLPFCFPALFRYARFSHGAVLRKLFGDDPEVVLALSALPTTLPPSALSYAFVAVLWAKVLRDGVFYPKGGMVRLTQALEHAVRENGGTVTCGKEIRRIERRTGRATGVRLQDGSRIEADWIIGAFNPYQGERLLQGGGRLYRGMHRLSRYRPASSALLFYTALPPGSLPKDWPYFVSICTENDLEANAVSLEQGSLEEGLTMVITTPTVLDPELAPPGHHSLKVMVHAPRAGLFEGRYGNAAALEGLRERIFGKIRAATGLDLARCALFVETATPMTLMRRTGNEEGAMYGLDAACGQVGPGRPPNRTALDNLLWVGHYTRPAHGIVGSALSGSFAADILQPRQDK